MLSHSITDGARIGEWITIDLTDLGDGIVFEDYNRLDKYCSLDSYMLLLPDLGPSQGRDHQYSAIIHIIHGAKKSPQPNPVNLLTTMEVLMPNIPKELLNI